MKVARVAGRGMIVRDGRLLMVRGDGDGTFWNLPGGRCEFDEDVKTCVKREIYEETGLTVRVGRLFAASEFSDPHQDFHILQMMFMCEVEAGEIDPSWVDSGGPVAEARFLSVQDMKDIPKIFPPFLREGAWTSYAVDGPCLYHGMERSRG